MASATINTGSDIANNFLSLSAQDLRELTNWPDALIEDYLAILRNLLAIANIIDNTVVNELFTTSNKVGMALGAISKLLQLVGDLDLVALAPPPPQGTMAEQSADNIQVFGGTGFVRSWSIIPSAQTLAFFSNIAFSTPALQVPGTTTDTSTAAVLRYSNNAFGPTIVLGKSRNGFSGVPNIVQNGDDLGSIVWCASDASNLNTMSAVMFVTVDDATPATNLVGGRWSLELNDGSAGFNLAYSIGPDLEHDSRIKANIADAYRVGTGVFGVGDDYILVDTTTGAEQLVFGNASTNPKYVFAGTKTLTHGSTTLLATTAALADGAAANAGTLTNAPAAGDPTKWVPIDDNGTIRYVPAW